MRLAPLLMLAACGRDPLRAVPNEPLRVVEQACHETVETIAMDVDDTFLFEQYPDAPQGGRPQVFYSEQVGSRCFPLVRPVGDIPEGEIVAARLLVTTVNSGALLAPSLLGGVAVWDERTTWADMEHADLPWDETTGAGCFTVSGRTAIDIPVEWVNEWRSGAHGANGLMLRTDLAPGFGAFASAESEDPPAFEIDYIACGDE